MTEGGIEWSRYAFDGRVFVISENREWWEKALKEAKIEGMRWHDLRHTTASLTSQKNINLKVSSGGI